MEVRDAAEDEHARFALFDATTGFLAAASRARPLMLVLDDVHAADRASLLLLRFAARELRSAPLLLLATYRTVEARLSEGVSELLGDVSREGQTIELRGLGRNDVACFVEGSTEAAPSDALVTAVHEATDGNPFFITELVGLLAAEGRLEAAEPGAPLGIPEGVRQAIGRRMELLSDGCAELLAAASVVGREFTVALLEGLTDRTRSELLERLSEASSAGLVVDRSTALSRYGFSHALIRETLYAGLAPARRLELHRATGEALEALYADDPEPHLAELAHHFFQAVQAGEAARALDYSARAGRRAMAQLAYEEAASHYEHALELLELESTGADERRLELLLELGAAQAKSGETAKKRQTALQAAALARQIGSAEGLARAAYGLGAGVWASSMTEVDEVVKSHLEEALAAVGPADSVLRLRLLARLGIELQFSSDYMRALDLTREALEMARRLGDPGALAWALTHRHQAVFGVEHPNERLRLSDEIVELGERTGRPQVVLWGHLTRVTNLVELGELHTAELEAGVVARMSEELRLPAFRWYLAMWKSMRALTEGRLEDSERLILEALEVGRPIHGDVAVFFYGLHLFTLRWLQGRLDEVVEGVAATVERERTSPAMRTVLALAYGELGRIEEARREFRRFAAQDFELPRNFSWPPCLGVLAVTCARLGEAAHAPRLYELLLQFEDRFIVGGSLAHALFWPASLTLGMLAALMGRLEDAKRHFEDGLAKSRRIGQRPYVAMGQVEYARALITLGGADEQQKVDGLLAEAVATAEEIGLHRTAAEARELQRDARERGEGDAVFQHRGDFWAIGWQGRESRLRDARGLHYLARLLENPNQEIAALELAVSTGSGAAGSVQPTDQRDAAEAGLREGGLGSAAELLDSRARAEYKRRLDELAAELQEAESFRDPERVARAREEIELLTDELTRATGRGGVDRGAPTPAERARVSVTKAIRQSLKRLARENEPLARHLEATIKTGTFCCYLPGSEPPSWRL